MSKQEYTFQLMGEWKNTCLDMPCPAQCWVPIKFNDEKYIIYLRWRHDDPWSGGLRDKEDKDFINGAYCLFKKYHEQYSFEELVLAKDAIIKLSIKWLQENKENNNKGENKNEKHRH